MFRHDRVQYQFHHIGLPTTEVKPGERYSRLFRMYTSDSTCGLVRTQWHRFEPGSSIDPLLQTLPHVAFKVTDLKLAIQGCRIILGPYEPLPGFHVAVIDDGGHPVELIETNLTDDEIWKSADGEDSLLYGKAQDGANR